MSGREMAYSFKTLLFTDFYVLWIKLTLKCSVEGLILSLQTLTALKKEKPSNTLEPKKRIDRDALESFKMMM